MSTSPECGLDVVIQQNPNNIEMACAVCPFARSGLCPNGDQLPFCRDAQPTGSGEARRNRGALQRLVAIIKPSCPGPRRP